MGDFLFALQDMPDIPNVLGRSTAYWRRRQIRIFDRAPVQAHAFRVWAKDESGASHGSVSDRFLTVGLSSYALEGLAVRVRDFGVPRDP